MPHRFGLTLWVALLSPTGQARVEIVGRPPILVPQSTVLRQSREELVDHTKAYAEAFNRRDLVAITSMLAHDIVLTDPAGRFEAAEARGYIETLLSANPDLSFRPTRIHACSDSQSLMEFQLSLSGKAFEGVDVLDWRNGKISEIRAYLHERPPSR